MFDGFPPTWQKKRNHTWTQSPSRNNASSDVVVVVECLISLWRPRGVPLPWRKQIFSFVEESFARRVNKIIDKNTPRLGCSLFPRNWTCSFSSGKAAAAAAGSRQAIFSSQQNENFSPTFRGEHATDFAKCCVFYFVEAASCRKR